MPKKLKIAVLISGRGSNLQALIDACNKPDYPAEIVMVFSNKVDAFGLKRAEDAGIATATISHKDYPDRKSFDQAMHQAIIASGAEFICMAGFMRLLSPWFVEQWHNKLVNIHPSLLPSFKGVDAQKQALDYGVKLAGCTVHFVRPQMDVGPIIAQATVPVLDDDTESALSARILEKEHALYVDALQLVALNKITIADEKVRIC